MRMCERSHLFYIASDSFYSVEKLQVYHGNMPMYDHVFESVEKRLKSKQERDDFKLNVISTVNGDLLSPLTLVNIWGEGDPLLLCF